MSNRIPTKEAPLIDVNEAWNVFSLSTGKDSVATLLDAREKGVHEETIAVVMADTGNEYEEVFEYRDYLADALGIEIQTIKADLSAQVIGKRETVRGKWVRDGAITEEEAEAICELLVPSGNPFLDLCMWKGRFPSRRAQFCTEQLKTIPIQEQIFRPIIDQGGEVVSWQGIRWDESAKRANEPYWEERMSHKDIQPLFEFYIHRPILHWKAEDTFKIMKRHGIKPNPLYLKGMTRVGCMPCINVKKMELREIAHRFPEHINKIAAWEVIVSGVAKRRNSTFFHAKTDPTISTKDNSKISVESHGIHAIVEWSRTQRGGRYADWLWEEPETNQCASSYGLCDTGN